MVQTLHRRIRDKFYPEPLPPPGTFNDKTVLITGGTAGLGLAAAQHFANLGANVIITSRSNAQGEKARQYIAKSTGVSPSMIHARELDMNSYASCVDFIQTLKAGEHGELGIDHAVLNAGVINPEFVESPEGWEQTIQVNTLSTVLLGLLLIAWMKEIRPKKEKPSHLVFVASRDHLDPDISEWAGYSAEGGILRHFSDKANWPTGELDPNYANSKLMLMYAVEEMCKRAVGEDGCVEVAINSVCPGLVSTDIARSIVKSSLLMRLAVPIYLGLLGKSADYGARFYVTAACADQTKQGKNIQALFTEDEYNRGAADLRSLATPNLKSETAQKTKRIVLNEIMTELREKVSGLEDLTSTY